jgi:hypothetical protein
VENNPPLHFSSLSILFPLHSIYSSKMQKAV